MKKFIRREYLMLILILMTIFVITGCNNGVGGIGDNTFPVRKFWARDFVTMTYYQLDAEKLAENSRCEIWVEKGSGVTAATAKKVADVYDSVIYPKMMNTFGYQANVTDLGKTMNVMEIAHYLATGETSSAKLTILLLDIRDGYTVETGVYSGGYFSYMNLFENNPNHPLYKYSNELDMIYLDTYPSVPGSDSANEDFAHEMQHLINFVSSFLFRTYDTTIYGMEVWVNEGLSAAAEWAYSGKHPAVRWMYYNDDPSGLIAKGNNFYVWDNHMAESPYANLDDYATVYLFFQWLRLQSKDGTGIYRDILTSNAYNYKAVTDAAKLKIDAGYNDNWSLLLRDWFAANFTNASTGRYGYMNEPDLKNVKAPMVPAGITSLDLFPGEGVYSRTSTAEAVPSFSGNIRYSGLSPAGGNPNDTTGYADGARLTYNVDTNNNGASASGSTTGIVSNANILMSKVSSSAQINSKEFSGPFKVDASHFLWKNGNMNMLEDRIINMPGNNNMLKFDRSTLKRVSIYE